MSTYFEHNLENIKSKLLLMGQLASESLRMAMEALVEADPVLAKQVKEKDEEIDELENEISDLVTTHLSTHSPVAADLRLLVATMKISHEIERIGDEAKAIARRSRKTAINHFHEIPQMAEVAQAMLKDALTVFAEFDQEKQRAYGPETLRWINCMGKTIGPAKIWWKRMHPWHQRCLKLSLFPNQLNGLRIMQ